MDVKQEFVEAVQMGREIEFRYHGQHYFESRTGDTNWYIYHEETQTHQYFQSPEDLLNNTILQGQNINDIWAQISLDCIL